MRGHGRFFIKGLSNESYVFKIFVWEWYLSEIEKENRVSGSDQKLVRVAQVQYDTSIQPLQSGLSSLNESRKEWGWEQKYLEYRQVDMQIPDMYISAYSKSCSPETMWEIFITVY